MLVDDLHTLFQRRQWQSLSGDLRTHIQRLKDGQITQLKLRDVLHERDVVVVWSGDGKVQIKAVRDDMELTGIGLFVSVTSQLKSLTPGARSYLKEIKVSVEELLIAFVPTAVSCSRNTEIYRDLSKAKVAKADGWPCISPGDPFAKWLGAMVGDIVLITMSDGRKTAHLVN